MVYRKISCWLMQLQLITHSNTVFEKEMEQKGVSYNGFRIFKSLPSNIQNYRNDRRRLKNKLFRYLIIHFFYSITGFLERKIGKDNT